MVYTARRQQAQSETGFGLALLARSGGTPQLHPGVRSSLHAAPLLPPANHRRDNLPAGIRRCRRFTWRTCYRLSAMKMWLFFNDGRPHISGTSRGVQRRNTRPFNASKGWSDISSSVSVLKRRGWQTRPTWCLSTVWLSVTVSYSCAVSLSSSSPRIPIAQPARNHSDRAR